MLRNVFFTSTSDVETTYDTRVLKHKITSPTFPWLFSALSFSLASPSLYHPLPPLSPPPPLPWPQGAVSYLNAGTLLWALIDCLCAPHSQSGQSAWGPGCLPYLPLLSRHTLRKKKTEEDGREHLRKREGERVSIYKRLSKLPPASSGFICFPSFSPSLFLSLSSLFFSQPETINGVLNQTSLVLF